MTQKRYLCIHGHFYQPPRENPWLEAIEAQDSAYPYHDWNEVVDAECYTANASSRILDDEKWIRNIVNNYAHISFNFGPTLLSWMERKAPRTYEAVLEADRRSRERFNGHGAALGQPYNHMILPLANARDRRTQIRWGIADFEHRFGRAPEGMWLPETAVDIATLEDLAAEGVRFTVLAPHQAGRVRALESTGPWTDVSGARIDPRRPYLQRLPSGKEIVLFFYDGPVSRAVAFEQLLDDGKRFADRLTGLFPPETTSGTYLVHIATDGETYGHHHRHGDMALAYALDTLDNRPDVELTIYGDFLERHPPRHQVEIIENTSWSCAHGIERWRSDCGCTTGGRPGWNQAWRAPLRNALDRLRDRLTAPYEAAAGELFHEPWAARDAYVEVVLDRSPESIAAFFEAHARRPLDDEERIRAFRLLEMQRHLLLMYTSCGWFFDDLSRIETVQVLQYAGRAIQLAEDLFGKPVAEPFLADVRAAQSNLPDKGNGADIYHQHVQRAAVDLEWVAAHYALSSLFRPYEDDDTLYCYAVRRLSEDTRAAGKARLAMGRIEVRSLVTEESGTFTYAVVHISDQSLHGGVRPFKDREMERPALDEIARTFDEMDITNAVRLIDRHFTGRTYSLRSLFRDEQRRIVDGILEETVSGIEATYESVYDQHAPLIRFLSRIGPRLPRVLHTTAEFVINARLRSAVRAPTPDPEDVRRLLADAARDQVRVDAEGTGRVIAQQIEERMADLAERPDDMDRVHALLETLEVLAVLPFDVGLRNPQNDYHRLLQTRYPDAHRRAEEGDEQATAWIEAFEAIGQHLKVRVAP